MTDPGSLLICGAFEGEVDLLRNYPSLNVIISGVGSMNSLYSVSEFIRSNGNIRTILFCGSCGVYPNANFIPGEIVTSNHFYYREIAELRGIVKVPDLIDKEIITDPAGRFTGISGKYLIGSGKTNSVNSIMVSSPEKNELDFFRNENISFENMEAFGIAYLARKISVNFSAIFSITNFVGENGSNEWRQNWRKGSDKLQKLILDILL